MTDTALWVSVAMIVIGALFAFGCVRTSLKFWEKEAEYVMNITCDFKRIIERLEQESDVRDDVIASLTQLIGTTQTEVEAKIGVRLKEEQRAEMHRKQVEAIKPPLGGITYNNDDVLENHGMRIAEAE